MHKLLIIAVFPIVYWACSLTPGQEDFRSDSNLAEITIQSSDFTDYERLDVVIQRNDFNGENAYTFNFGQTSAVKQTIEPGTYAFSLHYFKGDTKVVSTDHCSEEDRQKSISTVNSGPNTIEVYACFENGEPTTSVSIKPVIKDPNQEPTPFDGAAEFTAKQCSLCHGDDGAGASATALKVGSCTSCSDRATLIQEIETTMPPTNPDSCKGSCAEGLADYILNILN